MTLTQELLQLLARLGERSALPRIRGLILPPADAAGKEAEFCALELQDGSVGLSFTLLGDTLAQLRGTREFDALQGKDVRDVATWYGAREGAFRAVGLAAINAATSHFHRLAGYSLPGASSSLGLEQVDAGDHIGMIGLFRPLVERILATGAQLTVAELKPELAQQSERFRVTLDPRELAGCNKVISTSTVLLNDTLDQVLDACAGASWITIVGPTAGCFPDPLFARGIHTLGGVEILDTVGFRLALESGRPWGAFARKTSIARADYPGFDALLARLP